jgi:S-adenosylmethionine decarboxylase
MEKSLGTHIILDFYGCDSELIKHVCDVQSMMREASRRANFTVVTEEYHQFEPHGVSGATIIQESHLTFHSWAEHCYASIDIFYCGENDNVQNGIDYLVETLKPTLVERVDIPRGLPLKYLENAK